MKKKAFVTISILSLVLSMSTAAFAATNYNRSNNAYYGRGMMNTNVRMIDKNGNFLSLEEYTKKLDDEVAAGTITAEDKEFYLNMYNNSCSGNGTNSNGYRGGCGGRNTNRY